MKRPNIMNSIEALFTKKPERTVVEKRRDWLERQAARALKTAQRTQRDSDWARYNRFDRALASLEERYDHTS